jgi:hypothetical protein
MSTTQYTGLIPVDSVLVVNSALEALGYGPDNFSVYLIHEDDAPDANAFAVGCSCAMTQSLFDDFESIGLDHGMILIEGNFDENIAGLGLKKRSQDG